MNHKSTQMRVQMSENEEQVAAFVGCNLNEFTPRLNRTRVRSPLINKLNLNKRERVVDGLITKSSTVFPQWGSKDVETTPKLERSRIRSPYGNVGLVSGMGHQDYTNSILTAAMITMNSKIMDNSAPVVTWWNPMSWYRKYVWNTSTREQLRHWLSQGRALNNIRTNLNTLPRGE
jgi:hypothetical protein